MSEGGLGGALGAAELALRRQGLTGAQAFDALLDGLLARMGEPVEVGAEVLEAVAQVPLDRRADVLGLAYERFFSDLFKGRHGQFFTPPSVGRLLLSRLEIRRGELVLDPACGAAGLLVGAHRLGARTAGVELDPRLAALARVVLRLVGAPPHVTQGDMFSVPLPEVDVVVANPPFSLPVDDPDVLDAWGQERPTSSDALFVHLLCRVVRPGGRAGVVMPSSLLSNPRSRDLRERVDDAFHRRAVCALPEGVFRPFGGAGGRACLLWLERRRGAGDLAPPCRWSRLDDPGYDPRSIVVKTTSDAPVDALCAGEGWEDLPAARWTPARPHLAGVRVGDLCRLRSERVAKGTPGRRLDLADVDRVSGECHPVPDRPRSTRQRILAGDVLVSRLRPELGNVTVAHGESLLGSPEWVVLSDCPAPHLLWLILRTETWRAQLPTTGGQTRPRTTSEEVLGTHVPWPGELAGEAEAVLARIVGERRRLADRLRRIEAAVGEFVDGGDVDALRHALRDEGVEEEGGSG